MGDNSLFIYFPHALKTYLRNWNIYNHMFYLHYIARKYFFNILPFRNVWYIVNTFYIFRAGVNALCLKNNGGRPQAIENTYVCVYICISYI